MKNVLLLLLFCIPFFLTAQLKIETKNPIRPINLKLSKAQSATIENTGEGGQNLNLKKVKFPPTSARELSLNIVNPSKTPLHFAIGTNNQMLIAQIPENGVWEGNMNDYWVNLVIKTKKTELSYSIKTNNCYSFYWDSSLQAWNIKRIKCDVYEEQEK